MKGRGQLDVVDTKLLRERDPVFNRTIRIGVPYLARRQLLQRCSQHAHLHELWLERPHRPIVSGRTRFLGRPGPYDRIRFAYSKHFATS